jgi:hypothetical protein
MKAMKFLTFLIYTLTLFVLGLPATTGAESLLNTPNTPVSAETNRPSASAGRIAGCTYSVDVSNNYAYVGTGKQGRKFLATPVANGTL